VNNGAEYRTTSPLTANLVQSSSHYCRRVALLANSSFPVAFRLLPPAKRRAMDALYAFLRISDDLADEAGAISEKKARLNSWRAGFFDALNGTFNHPILPALIQAIRQYNIPPDLLIATLDGVESDIEPVHFGTFAELYPYCYRVASAVGLACVWIWGLRRCLSREEARWANEAAEAAGIAFQLTNILRDMNEDLARGRVYLPTDELVRFGVSVDDWRCSAPGGKVQDLIRFQVARAKDYYCLAEPLTHYLSTDGRAIYRVMMGTYRCLLDEIEKSDLGLFKQRIRVPRWRKGFILLSGWAVKFGLL
jgi:phytoene synthase